MLPWLITSASSCSKFERNYQTQCNLNNNHVMSVISACVNHMPCIIAVINPAASSDMLSIQSFALGTCVAICHYQNAGSAVTSVMIHF